MCHHHNGKSLGYLLKDKLFANTAKKDRVEIMHTVWRDPPPSQNSLSILGLFLREPRQFGSGAPNNTATSTYVVFWFLFQKKKKKVLNKTLASPLNQHCNHFSRDPLWQLRVPAGLIGLSRSLARSQACGALARLVQEHPRGAACCVRRICSLILFNTSTTKYCNCYHFVFVYAGVLRTIMISQVQVE